MVGSYLSGLSYTTAGQVTGSILGGVTETYGYDSQRMQLTSQTAASGGTQLMNLTYNYQAQAGQMGTGSTAGNAGQLISLSGTINGTTESASYSYDLLGRLVTSNQTSNGSSAQRRFGYDRWGNRTDLWDATSGGNQIQSVVLQQSGGAPTNRLTSVTNSGVTANYSYDAAGNVTNDGLHSYTYDAENRLVSVDGGATAQYKYDHQNRRVSKIIGSSWTHYIWQGSQVIAEHDGTTPYGNYGDPPYALRSARIDYIYAGSRMVYSRQWTSTATYTERFYLSDRLSARLMLDGSGNVIGRQGHLPFGEDFGESGTQEKHHFTSYERDEESGLDYAVNRGYAPTLGRFQQADPYTASGYMVDPQSWNRYSYVESDAVNYNDALGLFRQPPPPPPTPQNGAGGDPWGDGTGGDGINTDQPADSGVGGEGPQDIINKAINDVQDILKDDNPCSRFLGGSQGALEVLKAFAALAKPGFIQDTKVGIRQSGVQTDVINAATGFTYRLFENVTFNNRGAVFTSFDVSKSPVGTLPHYGSFSPNTREARALMILHELAHLIKDPATKTWLIPTDGGNPELSEKNTRKVEDNCGDMIRALK